MSVVTFTFNGVDFSELVEVHDIRRDIGNDTSIELGEISNIGSSLISSSEGPKYMEIDFSIWTPSRNPLKHKIAGLFHTDGVAKLTFSDEPDKYYLAKKTGKVSMRETEGYRSVGTVTFLIPDGVAHSTAYKTFQSPTASGTKLTFDLVNNGNVPAYPIIDVNHTSENGYLGFVCVEKDVKSGQPMSSMMEVGSRQKVTQTSIQRSATVLDYKDMSVALSAASRNGAVPGMSQSYSLDFTTVAGPNGSKRLGPPVTNDVGDKAGSLTWDIPQSGSSTISERIAWNMTVFANMYSQALPSITVCVSDVDGQFMYGVEYQKTYTGDYYQMIVYTADGAGGKKTVKVLDFAYRSFSWTYREYNPFGLKGDDIEISRNKQTLTVTYPGGTFTVQVPELKNKEPKKLHAVMTRTGRGDAFFGIHSLSYRRDFTEQPREVPNRYANGSVINIDCEKDRIVVNGLDQTNDLVHGSDFLVIPPGKSTLEIHSSSFATSPPRVEVKFEERWL
ncbi:TPA: distal tail protein Dit [Streptococcus suis]